MTPKSPFPRHAKKQPDDAGAPPAGPPQSLQDIMQSAGGPPAGPGGSPLGLPGPGGPPPGPGGTPMGGGPPLAGPMGANGGGLSPTDMLLAQQLIKKQRIAMLMKAHGAAIKQGSGTAQQGPLSPLDVIRQQFQNSKFPQTLQPQE